MAEDTPQTTLAQHVQKDPGNSPQRRVIPQQGLCQLQAKLSCSTLHIQFWQPKNVSSFYFPQDKKAHLWKMWQLIMFLSWRGAKSQETRQLKAQGVSGGPRRAGWVAMKCQRFSKGTQLSPALLIFTGQTPLTCLKPRRASHIYCQKLAFSLMVSWIQGNYGKDWWKSFNSCYGDSMMAARLKMSFINRHRAREHDNEWVNYTSIRGWYYPSAALIN